MTLLILTPTHDFIIVAHVVARWQGRDIEWNKMTCGSKEQGYEADETGNGTDRPNYITGK